MPIDVEIQDESGGTIARYEGPPLGLDFLKLAPADSACFRFILPWADATFNKEQIEVLKVEFGEVASKTTDLARQHEVKAVLEFLSHATGAHNYVKFIGD